MEIGNWVRRAKRPGKWHLVESIVADDAFVRCGRRMRDPGLEIWPTEPLTRLIGQPQNCRYCSR